MSYPKFTGASNSFFQVVGSPEGNRTAEGEVWTVTYEGCYDYYMTIRFFRWTISDAFDFIPNGLYIDDIKETIIYPSGSGQPGGVRVQLTFRESQNMSDSSGGETPTIPAKYECFTKTYQIPLHQLMERYSQMGNYVGASTDTGKLYEYAANWKNAATVEERQEAWERAKSEISNANQKNQFVDYCVKTSQGTEFVEKNVPILRRTQIQNAAPSTTSCGYIEEPPAGFGDLMPADYEWRKINMTSAREGRVAPYNVVEEWEGALEATGGWDNDLYGTYAERIANYKTFAAPV